MQQSHDILIGPEDPKDHLLKKYINTIIGRYSNRVPVGTHKLERKGYKASFTAQPNGVLDRLPMYFLRSHKVPKRMLVYRCMVDQQGLMLFLGSISGHLTLLLSSLLSSCRTCLSQHRRALMHFSGSYHPTEIKVIPEPSKLRCW